MNYIKTYEGLFGSRRKSSRERRAEEAELKKKSESVDDDKFQNIVKEIYEYLDDFKSKYFKSSKLNSTEINPNIKECTIKCNFELSDSYILDLNRYYPVVSGNIDIKIITEKDNVLVDPTFFGSISAKQIINSNGDVSNKIEKMAVYSENRLFRVAGHDPYSPYRIKIKDKDLDKIKTEIKSFIESMAKGLFSNLSSKKRERLISLKSIERVKEFNKKINKEILRDLFIDLIDISDYNKIDLTEQMAYEVTLKIKGIESQKINNSKKIGDNFFVINDTLLNVMGHFNEINTRLEDMGMSCSFLVETDNITFYICLEENRIENRLDTGGGLNGPNAGI